LSHALSAFIRIYQIFLLKYSRITPAKIGQIFPYIVRLVSVSSYLSEWLWRALKKQSGL